MLWIAATGRLLRGLPLLLLLLVGWSWTGCSPDAFLLADEDRDRNFQRARDAERLGDYEGAAEYYEKALERNPRSALAHLGYASLCEGQLRRFADAVYHYQRYLRLRPNDPKAEDIRRRVTNCTERLATMVPLVIRSETIARDLEATRRENQALRTQVTNLFALSAYWSNECQRALALANPGVPGDGRDHGSAGSPGSVGSVGPTGAVGGGGNRPWPRMEGSPVGSSSTRIHRLQRGETFAKLSRQYGVSVRALKQANPGLDERRLKPGTSVRIPPRG